MVPFGCVGALKIVKVGCWESLVAMISRVLKISI